ncbi:MAG: hypothetical protein KAR40_17425, partial [Candidatus Sabulitectum sp.]|nr:hypothetical protein [Candidatus Sabulitectum sp.]
MLLEGEEIPSRAKLSEKVCEHFSFVDARGHLQKSSCVIALGELAAAGYFILPSLTNGKSSKGKKYSSRRLSTPVPDAVDVPAKAGNVKGLKLVIVTTDEQKRT